MGPLILLAALTCESSAALRLDETTVDVQETNHFYDENGRHVFDQIIYYDWHGDESRYHVRAWRLVKTRDQLPVRARGGYTAVWMDGEALRKVRSMSRRESWTQFDREVSERQWLPRENRREFPKPGK